MAFLTDDKVLSNYVRDDLAHAISPSKHRAPAYLEVGMQLGEIYDNNYLDSHVLLVNAIDIHNKTITVSPLDFHNTRQPDPITISFGPDNIAEVKDPRIQPAHFRFVIEDDRVVLQNTGRENVQAFMPHSPVEQIQHLNGIIEAINAQQKLPNYDDRTYEHVQDMERPTKETPVPDRQKGYYAVEAIDGYMGLIRCFHLLHIETLDEQQNKNIENLLDTFALMREDAKKINGYSTEEEIEGYAAHKYQELEEKGEIFIPSGYRGWGETLGHFNIVRIKKDGSNYTYTLYDAGAEATVVLGNTVLGIEEHNLRDPSEERLKELIGNISVKGRCVRGNPRYINAFKAIQDMLGDKVSEKLESSQEKQNCVTRSQRIVIAAFLNNIIVSDAAYKFSNDPKHLHIEFIKEALERKMEALREFCLERALNGTDQQLGLLPNPGMMLDGRCMAAMFDPGRYKRIKVNVIGLGEFDNYRLEPGLLNAQELVSCKAILEKSGIRAHIRQAEDGKLSLCIYNPPKDIQDRINRTFMHYLASTAASERAGNQWTNEREHNLVHPILRPVRLQLVHPPHGK